MSVRRMSAFVLVVLFITVATSRAVAAAPTPLSDDDCRALGFIRRELACSTCEVLATGLGKDLDDPTRAAAVVAECKQCCVEHVVGEAGADRAQPVPSARLYGSAKVEVPGYLVHNNEDWRNLAQKLPTEFFGTALSNGQPTVQLVPMRSRATFIHMYLDAGAGGRGTPDTTIDAAGWDANKVLEFLQNTIGGSRHLKQAERAAKKAAASDDDDHDEL